MFDDRGVFLAFDVSRNFCGFFVPPVIALNSGFVSCHNLGVDLLAAKDTVSLPQLGSSFFHVCLAEKVLRFKHEVERFWFFLSFTGAHQFFLVAFLLFLCVCIILCVRGGCYLWPGKYLDSWGGWSLRRVMLVEGRNLSRV